MKASILEVSMSMSLLCVSIKVFCAERCDRSSLECFKNNSWCPGAEAGPGVWRIRPVQGGQPGRPLSQPAVSSVCSLWVNTWPPLASLNPGSQTGSFGSLLKAAETWILIVIWLWAHKTLVLCVRTVSKHHSTGTVLCTKSSVLLFYLFITSTIGYMSHRKFLF